MAVLHGSAVALAVVSGSRSGPKWSTRTKLCDVHLNETRAACTHANRTLVLPTKHSRRSIPAPAHIACTQMLPVQFMQHTARQRRHHHHQQYTVVPNE
jgi:hypothetical protein